MALTDFTTFDDVRSVLGVSEDELEDETLSLSVYDFGLVSEMEDIDLSIINDYTTVREMAAGSRTDAETRLYQAVRLFATYSVARHLTAGLPLFSPREITDGKASAVRYADNPYKETIKAVEKGYERWRARLVDVYAAYKNTTAVSTTALNWFSVASPTDDPVTGS